MSKYQLSDSKKDTWPMVYRSFAAALGALMLVSSGLYDLHGTVQSISDEPAESLHSFNNKYKSAWNFFEKTPRHYFEGKKGIRIAYWMFRAPLAIPRGSIILVQGYTETAIKHAENIFDLIQSGFDVFIFDHRGMGLSGRLGSHPQMVHVENFQDYIDDFKAFVSWIVLPNKRTPRYSILAHSMGALVSASAILLHDGTEREFIQPARAALTGGLFELNTRPLSNNMTYYLMKIICALGFGEHYVWGKGAIAKDTLSNLENKVTTSKRRRQKQLELFYQRDYALMAGPSNRWVLESIGATKRLFAALSDQRTRKNPASLPPMKLFAPGREFLVQQAGFKKFCDLVETCQFRDLPNSMHEVLHENDEIRSQVLADVVQFFAEDP